MSGLWPVFFFLFAFPPQNFRATILDSTGGAIVGAHVELSGNGSSFPVLSQADGAASLDEIPPGVYVVRVTAPGFLAATTTVTLPAEPFTITMQVAAHSDDILVTATRTETPLGMIGVSATVLTTTDLAHQQNPSLYELLRDVPGMAVANTSRRGGSTSVYTRGAGKNANLVLLDGIKINDPGGDFNFAHLTSTNVERVEVVRGPQSALYGPDAAASVVQLVSRRGTSSDGPLAGFGSFQTGTFETRHYNAGLSGLVRRFDYSTAAERLDTEGSYPNDAYRNLTLSLNTGFQVDKVSSLRFNYRRVSSRVGVPNRVGFGIQDRDANRQNWFTVVGGHYQREGAVYSQRVQFGLTRFRDVFADYFPDGPFTISAVVAGTPGARGPEGVRLVQIVPTTATAGIVLPPGARFVTRTVRLSPTPQPARKLTQRRSAEYQGTWSYSSSSSLIAGYEWQQEREKNDYGQPLRNNHGLFLHHQHRIGTRMFLTESIRVEDNSAYHTKATPRLSLSYVVNASLRVKTSWGTGISEPSFLHQFARDPTFVGNPALRPERSRSAEAGVEQHLWNSHVIIEATVFHNAFRDLIVFVSPPPPLLPTWENVEASRARGTELIARFRNSWLQIRSQYTFLDTRVTAASAPASPTTGVGQELPRRPRHSGALDATIFLRRIVLNADATFVGERQDSDGIGLGVVRNVRYQKVDCGGSYALRKSVDLFARVDNVLNQRYMEVLGYAALSRNFLAGVRYRWGGQ